MKIVKAHPKKFSENCPSSQSWEFQGNFLGRRTQASDAKPLTESNAWRRLQCLAIDNINAVIPSHFPLLALLLAAPNSALGQNTSQVEYEVPLSSLSLSISLTPQFMKHAAVSNSEARDICEALGNNLREGAGPWGFGLFKEKPSCNFNNSNSTQSAPSRLVIMLILAPDASRQQARASKHPRTRHELTLSMENEA